MTATHHRSGRLLAIGYRVAAVVLAALPLATCNLIAGTDELQPHTKLIPCHTAEDCTEPCHDWTCVENDCVDAGLWPVGTPCGEQEQCDGQGTCHCPPLGCKDGHDCNYDRDCSSHYCKSGKCEPAPCPTPCPGVCWQCTAGGCAPVKQGETVGELCPSGCDGAGACPSCDNGLLDGAETDTDCGGPGCPPCADGQSCAYAADCASCICVGVGADATCAPPECGNGVQDGCESDVDCGGACGSTCAAGEKCHAKQDCASHWCDGETCKEVVP